jgi:hypothetical protein
LIPINSSKFEMFFEAEITDDPPSDTFYTNSIPAKLAPIINTCFSLLRTKRRQLTLDLSQAIWIEVSVIAADRPSRNWLYENGAKSFCQLGILSFCRLVILPTCHLVNLPYYQLSYFIIIQWNVSMTKCQDDKMSSWQVDKMSSWQNVKLTKCHGTMKMSVGLSTLEFLFFILPPAIVLLSPLMSQIWTGAAQNCSSVACFINLWWS